MVLKRSIHYFNFKKWQNLSKYMLLTESKKVIYVFDFYKDKILLNLEFYLFQ